MTKKNEPELASVSQMTDAELLQTYREQVALVSLSVEWIPLSSKISDEHAGMMLDAVGAQRKGVSMSARMFCAGHPAVDSLNAARQMITAYRDSMTGAVVIAGKSMDREAALTSKGEAKARKVKKSEKTALPEKRKGERLILLRLIEEFDEHVQGLVASLYTQARNVDAQMESIKEHDQKILKDLYRDENYPKSAAQLIEVVGPSYEQFGMTLDFEKHCPNIAKRLVQEKAAEVRDTMQLVAAEYTRELQEFLRRMVTGLSQRIRLYPKNTAYAYLENAEVLEVMLHKEYPDQIPEGMRMLEVKYVEAGKAKATIKTIGPFADDQYASLGPIEVDEKRRLVDSTVGDFMVFMGQLDNFSTLMGPHAQPLRELMTTLRSQITKPGSSTAVVTEELRKSTVFRNETRSLLKEAEHTLVAKMQDVISRAPRRRIAVIGGMAQIVAAVA